MIYFAGTRSDFLVGGNTPVRARLRGGLRLVLLTVVLGWLSGCGRTPVDQALESDANGYLCRGCKTKFAVDREIFADFCPGCKSPKIDQVVGFVCAPDGHVTVAPRGRGSVRCEQCGQATSGLSIPRAKQLQEWGATKRTRKEVCGS